jgi:solute carrier family 25 S-adenosylmethionine transporter 26
VGLHIIVIVIIILILIESATTETITSTIIRMIPFLEDILNMVKLKLNTSPTTLLVTLLLLLVLPLTVIATSTSRLSKTTIKAPSGGKSSTQGNLQAFVATIKDAKEHLVAAAVARGTCTAIMYPMDLIKTRIQVERPNPWKLEGLFDGVGGSLLGQIPYGVLTFGSYEMYKKKLQERFPHWTPALTYALAAVGGDVTGSIFLCPSEVVKSKVQAGIFKTSTQAFSTILKTKGFGGLYQGFFGLAARDIPFRVCQLTSYEIVKSQYLKFKLKRRPNQSSEVLLSPIESAAGGAIAGTFSAAVTTPLDRIKTLMAVNEAGTTVVACASMILQEEGAMGLMRGLWPRVCYVAPSVTIFFIVYEATQQHLKNRNTLSS